MPQILSGIGQVCTYILKIHDLALTLTAPQGSIPVTGEETEVDSEWKILEILRAAIVADLESASGQPAWPS